MNIIDDTTPQEVQPGSLNFIPADPEVPTIVMSAETTPTVETAIETKQENEPIYELPKTQQEQPKPEEPLIKPYTAAPVIPQVVDKSGETTKTHHLDTTHDALTKIADDDEEKFIKEVEAAHGHK